MPEVPHVPVRTCIGCRASAPTTMLWRCALGLDGTAVVARHAPGRGAWLCAGSITCFDRAVQARRFDRAWRHPVEADTLDRLRSVFASDLTDARESTTGSNTAASAVALVKG